MTPSKLSLVALCAATTWSWQDYLFEQKCPAAVREAQKTVAELTPLPADILFVVDNSSSMADEQERLAANFDAFINEIAGAGNLDYRIAVVTTDLSTFRGNFERSGKVRVVNDQMSMWRQLVTIQSNNCQETTIPHGCFRAESGSPQVIESKNLSPTEQISHFRGNVTVGSCGAGDEQGLEATITALKNADGCNQGFLRPEANLIIVLVSDEEDAPGENGQRSVMEIVQELKSLKPISQIRVAAIVGSVDGEASVCRPDAQGQALAQCGSICDQGPPPAGSETPCVQNQSGCPTGERCVANRCISNELWVWQGTTSDCRSCTFFDVDDCCAALPGQRYVDFAKAIEAEVAAMNEKIEVHNCRPPENTQAACLVDSICQEDFSKTLTRIARELVIESTYRLDPPASYPEGVTLRIRGGRYPEPKDAVYGTDFTISNGGASLEIINGAFIPQGNQEKLDIFFTVEKELDVPRVGACADTSTTT